MTSELPSPAPRAPVPPPLAVATSLVGVEGGIYLLLAVVQVSQARGEAMALAVTATLFFLFWGGGLLLCAWNLWRLASWARAPVVLAQLVQIMVGASFWGGSTTIVAVVAIAVGVLALAGIFHPQSLAALEPPD